MTETYIDRQSRVTEKGVGETERRTATERQTDSGVGEYMPVKDTTILAYVTTHFRTFNSKTQLAWPQF